ncbi:MAG: hypothetical protein KGL39_44840 [Patescibacteria group bacterium]|nr:hypothetical protein [Patescibacteria group bacterium]
MKNMLAAVLLVLGYALCAPVPGNAAITCTFPYPNFQNGTQANATQVNANTAQAVTCFSQDFPVYTTSGGTQFPHMTYVSVTTASTTSACGNFLAGVYCTTVTFTGSSAFGSTAYTCGPGWVNTGVTYPSFTIDNDGNTAHYAAVMQGSATTLYVASTDAATPVSFYCEGV